MVKIGVIGCGHWGPNHIRIFSQLSDSQSVSCADPDAQRLEMVQQQFPSIHTTTNYMDLLKDPNIDAVCIASPTNTHATLTREALQHGKHVLCEKPLALQGRECEELGALAEEKGKVLVVGHIFMFNAGIQCLKELIESGELGKIHYAYAIRTNLGPFRYDVNALWDLAPHDISIFDYLFGATALDVSARGQKCLGSTHEDLAFVTMTYPDNVITNIHVSWLDPRKVRQITLVGDKKMVVWDDLDNMGPIKLYDKHVEKTSTFYATYGEFQLLSKEGSITIPKISSGEPLKAQARFFLDCIQGKASMERCDAAKARSVVQTLEAIQASMDQGGSSVRVNENVSV